MADSPALIEPWTASDGYVANCRRYLPKETPRLHIVCLHGIQSHSGWYEYSSAKLGSAGYAVSYMDRRGSGLNQTARGDAPSFRRLLLDICEFVRPIRQEMPELPVILCACSWGGKLATAMCRRHPGVIDGLILVAPGICPKVRPPFGERVRIAFSWLFRPRRRFPIPLSDPSLFTATPKWQEFIANDELSLRQATARLLAESTRLDMYLRFVPRWVSVPVLLQLAEHDRIIDNQRTRNYFERLATPDKQVIEYQGAHHTLEFEPDPDRFVDDIISWLRKREPTLILRRRALAPSATTSSVLNPSTCLTCDR